MTEQPASRPTRKARRLLSAVRAVPPKALARFAVFAAVLAVGFFLLRWPPVAQHLTQEKIVAFFDTLRGKWWSPVLLVGLHLVSGVIGMPSSPLVIGGGAVFGPVWGTCLNVLGLLLGAFFGYLLARHLGRDLVSHLAGDRLRRAEQLFNRRGFWPLVSLRFFPLPFSVINYGAALAGVRLPAFMVATVIGLAPTIAMHTSFAAWLASAPDEQRASIVVMWGTLWLGLAALTAYPTWRATQERKRRYADLKARRRERATPPPQASPLLDGEGSVEREKRKRTPSPHGSGPG